MNETAVPPAASPRWHLYVPKLITMLRRGYTFADFSKDTIAGLTVAIVALPLAMALAIASGTTPDKGLVTAIVAGFLISALGGSRFQIGGPTGAFVVVVFNVIAQHGYDGLLLATLMASVMLIASGLAGFGTVIKYMPQPVITGFTSGIALIIFSSQVKDFFGLVIDKVPADFAPKWMAYFSHAGTLNPYTLAVGGASLGLIILLRRYAPKLPAFLLAVVLGSVAVWALQMPIETIGSRFGGIPNSLPIPSLPSLPWERFRELLPSAFTIAFLAGIESLLSAVVADGMTGRRHRSNCELVAQGIANGASVFFGGLPATGAIARTVTNIRSGGRSPVAGMMHAVFVFLFMFFLAPLAKFVPLASLAAVLMIVAWNMSEVERFLHLMKAPRGDRLVLVLTFLLTALVDLTVAIEVGVVLAALTFMYRMTRVMEIETHTSLIEKDRDDLATPSDRRSMRRDLPKGVDMFQFRGPFFFGVTSMLGDVLDRIVTRPRLYILEMSEVPLIDASGASALGEFLARCKKQGVGVILSGLREQPHRVVRKMEILDQGDHVRVAANYAEAIEMAKVGSDDPNGSVSERRKSS